MPDNIQLKIDTTALSAGMAEAGADIERIAREQISPAAALIEDAFQSVGTSIETSLSSAAEHGALSLKKLTRSILNDLRRLAIDRFVRKPVQNLLTNVIAGAFGGGRANGGAVAPGQSFLVGERGPELFTPHQAGRVSPLAAQGVSVNITLPGVTDAESFRRSETQVAAALARAVGRGRRNL